MGGIIGLDWNVVIRVAEASGIPVDRGFFRRLRVWEQVMIEEAKRKAGQ